MSPSDVSQIHHIARMAFLAMSARGVAASEFESSPEIQSIHFVVSRTEGGQELPVDVEFMGAHSVPMGGMSI